MSEFLSPECEARIELLRRELAEVKAQLSQKGRHLEQLLDAAAQARIDLKDESYSPQARIFHALTTLGGP